MHPVIYDFGPVAIYSYGMMLGSAFILGILISIKVGKNFGINPDHIIDLGIVILLSAVVGSRLFYILENFSIFKDEPKQVFMFWSGGFVYYGGFFASVLASLIYCKVKKISFLDIADSMAPSIALGIGIARVGCFLGGCCYGTPTTFILGVTFPPDSPPSYTYGQNHLIHPTQLYGSVMGALLFLFLYSMAKNRKFKGQVFWLLFTIYPFIRVFLEFFREHVDRTLLIGLTVSQLLSPFMIVIGIIGYFLSKRRNSPSFNSQ